MSLSEQPRNGNLFQISAGFPTSSESPLTREATGDFNSQIDLPVYMLALEAGMPNCDSINLGMNVMKAVTMAHSAV